MDTKVQQLVDAALELLAALIDAEQHGPPEVAKDSEYPRDHTGKVWYPDVWALKQAVDEFDKVPASPSC